MSTNFKQAKSWINSAISDISIILTAIKKKYFSLVAFKSQFAVEKLNKSILSFFGLKIEKIHTPSEILTEIINNQIIISNNEKTKNILKEIIGYSIFFESQGTKTRYGIVQNENLISAEEIYSKLEDVKEFIERLVAFINLYLILLKDIFNINEIDFKEIKKLKSSIRKLKKWI